MKTYQTRAKDIKRHWHLFDAQGKILGRMSSEIAHLLMGKHHVSWVPHLDMGDFVVVINAKKVKLTGRKEKQKKYSRHSGFPGGYKEISFERLKEKTPEKIISFAVKRMLPDNRLRAKRMARLKIFAGENHSYNDKIQVSNFKSQTN